MNTRGGQTLRCGQGRVAAGGPGDSSTWQAPAPTGGSPDCNYGFTRHGPAFPFATNLPPWKPPGRIFSVWYHGGPSKSCSGPEAYKQGVLVHRG